MTRIGCFLLVLAASGCGSAASDSSAPNRTTQPPPDARSILQSMSDRYRSASTYSDEGTFTKVIREMDGKAMTGTAHLRTRWAAPDRMRYEYRDEGTGLGNDVQLTVVWTPRPGVTKQWFLDKETDERSVGDAINALEGVSSGASGLAPHWLLEHGAKLDAKYELHGRASCGKASCYELVAPLSPTRTLTLSVDTSDYALRKAVWRGTSGQEPIPEEALKLLDAKQKEMLLAQAGHVVEFEYTLELEPTFDRPLEPTTFDFVPKK